MGRAVLLAMLWLFQALIIAVAFSGNWIEEQLRGEQSYVEAYLGEAAASYLSGRSAAIYKSWFVDTQIVASTYEALIPDGSRPQHGMEGLAPWLFTWLEKRLDTGWWMVYQAIYRSLLFLYWIPYLGVLLGAAAIDGFVERKIKKTTHQPANAVRYHTSARTVLVLAFMPLLYLSLPINVHPILVPAWAFLLAIASMVMAANAQHRI